MPEYRSGRIVSRYTKEYRDNFDKVFSKKGPVNAPDQALYHEADSDEAGSTGSFDTATKLEPVTVTGSVCREQGKD